MNLTKAKAAKDTKDTKDTNQGETSAPVPSYRILLRFKSSPALSILPLKEGFEHRQGKSSLSLALHRGHLACSEAAGEKNKSHVGRLSDLQDHLTHSWWGVVVLSKDGGCPRTRVFR